MFEDVLRFWLDRGVDGFRVDVAHGLVKEAGLRDQVVTPTRSRLRGAPGRTRWWSGRYADEPMWDQPEVHDVYRRWRRVLDEYDGDRMAVAEAWTRTAEAMARYVRADELHQAFNFHWLLAPMVGGRPSPRSSTRPSTALGAVGGAPTWVLSNHDVVRHPTRYGGGEVGLARARAATLVMLALPGSAYLYQGEELGLEEVDVAPEHRQDPSWFRTGEPGPGRLPGADPVGGRPAAVRLRAGQRSAVDPAAGRLGGAHGRGPAGRPGLHAGVLPAGAGRAAQARCRRRRRRRWSRSTADVLAAAPGRR